MTNDSKAKVNFYGNIITRLAIVAFLFLWMLIDRRLSNLEHRMRCLELQVTAISVELGVDTDAMISSSQARQQQHLEPTGGKLLY